MFYWQHICYIWWIYFSTDSLHSHWYQLCSSSSRCFPLLLRGFSRKRKAAIPIFNFTFCYTENVLSLNNSKVGDCVDQIYPNELEIKDTTGTARFASYLDLHLEIDSESRLRTKCYDKRRTDNTMSKRKWTKEQIMVYKILHRKQEIEEHEPY